MAYLRGIERRIDAGLDPLAQRLQAEGVAAFQRSWYELIATIDPTSTTLLATR